VEAKPEDGEEEIRKMAESQEKIQKYLTLGKVVKVIFVKGKTINYVVI